MTAKVYEISQHPRYQYKFSFEAYCKSIRLDRYDHDSAYKKYRISNNQDAYFNRSLADQQAETERYLRQIRQQANLDPLSLIESDLLK